MELIFPCSCVVCDEEGPFLCKKCVGKIVLIGRQTCPVCYKEGSFKVCESCKGLAFLDGLIAACRYENNPVVHKSIHEFKYNFIEDLAVPFGKLMAKRWMAEIERAGDRRPGGNFRTDGDEERFILCPVPLHKKRLKWRGFNQAKLLSDEISRECGLPVLEILERTKFKRPQMELKREERLKNVVDAFRIAPGKGPHGGNQNSCGGAHADGIPQNIILIDDVATTLSTLNSCAKTLKEGGAKNVYALVIARAVK